MTELEGGSTVIASGTQWLADFSDCRCDITLLNNAAKLELRSMAIVNAANLQIMGRVFHQIQPVGATGLILMAESHLEIHTWPERGSVAVDLYVCNMTDNNTYKAETVFRQLIYLLRSAAYTHQLIHRQLAGRDVLLP